MEQQTVAPDEKSVATLVEEALGRKQRRQLKEHARVEKLRPLLEKLMSESPDTQHEAACELRTLLDGAHAPPLDDVLHAGFVPRLLQLSHQADRQNLQFVVLWVLTSLTSGTPEQTRVVVDCGAMDIFERLLESPAAQVREQAASILANIAGASVELRDAAVASGAVNHVLNMLNVKAEAGVETRSYYDKEEKVWKLRGGKPDQPLSVTRMGAHCLNNLCQGEPSPVLGEATAPLFHTLGTLVMSTDEEALVKACSALSCLNHAVAEHATVLLKYGTCVRLVELLSHPSRRVQSVAASAVESIARGSSQGMEALLQCNPVPALKALLSGGNPSGQKSSCSVVADILALGNPQLQEVVDAGIVPLLVRSLQATEDGVRSCAARAVSVLSSKCSPAQMQDLVTPDCVARMLSMLEPTAFQSSTEAGRVALSFVEHVLEAGRNLQQERGAGENYFAKLVEEADGLRMLKAISELTVGGDLPAKARGILRSSFGVE